MKNTLKVMERHFHHVTKKNWDCVIIISGDEGVGKSNVGLTLLDWWLTQLKREVGEEDIKYMALDPVQFVDALDSVNRYEPVFNDEAADLSNKRSMSKFNVMITKAYQIIRGANMFTVLTIPSIFDLDGFFTRRRARGLIHLDGRGKLRYYNRDRLRFLMARNSERTYKTVKIVDPLFFDYCPIYKGPLRKPYEEKKDAKIEATKKQLKEDIRAMYSETPNKLKQAALKMRETMSSKEIAQILGIGLRTAQEWIKAARDANEKKNI